MDTIPITRLEELDAHLDDVATDPSLPLDAKLFDEVSLQLTEANIPPLIPRLLPKLTGILRSYTQDPAVLVDLAIRLLGPVTFVQALSLASEESLVQALQSPAPSANLLALAVLHKAAARPADAAVLALMPALLAAFLTRWLAAPQVEVGERAGRVLGDLLDTDYELAPAPALNGTSPASPDALVLRRSPPGQGKLWRRVFLDSDVYGLIVALVTAAPTGGARHPAVATDHQLSLAQGRLLRLLPRLAALNFAAVAVSPEPPALLPFAALRMVDAADPLMHLSLVDFFEALVSVLRVADRRAPPVIETLRALLRDATADDPVLRRALLTLHERTVPEEADSVRAWVRELMPDVPTRVAGWQS